MENNEKRLKTIMNPLVSRFIKYFAIFAVTFGLILAVMFNSLMNIAFDTDEKIKKTALSEVDCQNNHYVLNEGLEILKSAEINIAPLMNESEISSEIFEPVMYKKQRKKLSPSRKINLWNNNEALRNAIVKIADKTLPTAEVDLNKVPEYLDYNKINYDYSPILKSKLIAALGVLALESGEIAFFVKADMARLRIAHAISYNSYGYPHLIGLMIQLSIIGMAERELRDLYVNNDSILSDTGSRYIIKKALAARADYLSSAVKFSDVWEVEKALSRAYVYRVRKVYPITMFILDLIYGDPSSYIEKISNSFSNVKNKNYSEMLEIAKNLRFIPSGYFELLKTHPLKGICARMASSRSDAQDEAENESGKHNMYVSMIIDNAKIDICSRLLVLGGFARLFYIENKRWPNLLKDKDFLKEAGPAAIDPIDYTLMKSKPLDDGSIKYYSIGPDCIDNGGDTKEDEIINVNVPLNVN